LDLNAWHTQYDRLYGRHIAAGHYQDALLGLSYPGNWAGDKIPLLDTDAIDRKLTQLDRAGKDIYFRIVPLEAGSYGHSERGAKERNLAMPCAFGDGDTIDGVHQPFKDGGEFKGFRHPATDEVLAMYHDLFLPPTLTVASGGGVHPYWVFDQTMENALPGTESYKMLLRLDYTIKEAAKARGFGMDTGITSDAARILRVAGSRNFKRSADPAPVTILDDNPMFIYSIDELDELLDHIPVAAPKQRTLASIAKIGDRKTSHKWSTAVPVSFLMEGVWGMETGDGDMGNPGENPKYGRKWVFPREDGTVNATALHAKTWVAESGTEWAVAYGNRIQEEWGVASYAEALTSWDLLCTIMGGDLAMARFITKTFPKPTEDLLDNLRAINEARYEQDFEAA
jgi:hypothetical protein